MHGSCALPSHHGIHLYGDGSFLDFLYLSALKLLLCSEKPSYLPSLNIPQAETGGTAGQWIFTGRCSFSAVRAYGASGPDWGTEAFSSGVILPTNSP